MANPTTNYGFVLPTPTDLVTDLPADFDVALQGVDTQMLTNANAAIAKAIVDAKGDLIAATAADTVSRLAIGANNTVLTADSAEATGMKWATPAGGSFVGCGLTKSTTQSISTSTVTALTFDTESFDTSAFHSTATNTSRITIPAGKAGYYLISATATFAAAATASRSSLIKKNGTTFQTFVGATPSSGADTTLVHSLVLNLAEADFIEFFVFQSSGGSININGNAQDNGATNFGCTYLGA